MLKEKYYVQRLARQSAVQIVPFPDNLIIPPRHLNGISNDDFVTAFHTYQDMLRQIYNDVQKDPESFGMVCLEIETDADDEYGQMGPVTKDEAKSRKSFFRLPNTLLALARVGRLTDDGLVVNTESFINFNDGKTAMKIKTPEAILERLCDYGFEFEGVPDDYKIKQSASFVIYYPDDKNVLTVLKAFSCVQFYEKFISADYRHLLTENGDNQVFELTDVLRILENETDKQLVRELYMKLEAAGYFIKIEYNSFTAKIRFAPGKSKKEFLMTDIDRDSALRIPVRLQNIGNYAERINSLTPNILRQTLSGRDCCDCGYCNKCIHFSYDKKAYRKCAVICCGFAYTGFSGHDVPSFLQLIDWEIKSE